PNRRQLGEHRQSFFPHGPPISRRRLAVIQYGFEGLYGSQISATTAAQSEYSPKPDANIGVPEHRYDCVNGLTRAYVRERLSSFFTGRLRLSRVNKAPSQCPRRSAIRWVNPAQGAGGGVTPMWVAVLKQRLYQDRDDPSVIQLFERECGHIEIVFVG